MILAKPSNVILTGYRMTSPPSTASGSEMEAIMMKYSG